VAEYTKLSGGESKNSPKANLFYFLKNRYSILIHQPAKIGSNPIHQFIGVRPVAGQPAFKMILTYLKNLDSKQQH
jgi:hypothetical protein